jgi:hypothetical protein
MFAVVGVLRSAKVDGPEAVACVKAGFTTHERAVKFATEYFPTDKRKRIYGDIYVQSYEGDIWKPDGGRCFYYARLALKEQHDRLLSYCGEDDVPRVVIGECNRVAPDGKQVRGKHAWINDGTRTCETESSLFFLAPVSYLPFAAELLSKCWRIEYRSRFLGCFGVP